MKVIEGFCDGHREGVTEIDFGPGHAQYKQVLSNQEWRETSSIFLLPPSRESASICSGRLSAELDQMIKNVLARHESPAEGQKGLAWARKAQRGRAADA